MFFFVSSGLSKDDICPMESTIYGRANVGVGFSNSNWLTLIPLLLIIFWENLNYTFMFHYFSTLKWVWTDMK